MEMHDLHDSATGETVKVFPRPWFVSETAEYRHDKACRQLLDAHWAEGKSPQEAIAIVRERLGAMTRKERSRAWQDKLDGWRKDRESRSGGTRGRPPREMTLEEFKAAVRAVLMKELARCMTLRKTPECSLAFEAMKRQILLD